MPSPIAASPRIGIVGLGYVGLPLAVEFGRLYDTWGMDLNAERVEQLRQAHDSTGEVDAAGFQAAEKLRLTTSMSDLKDCDTYIVTVPTPVDHSKRPNLTPIVEATKAIGAILKRGDLVIYESTVYPGVTEEICAPLLEELSGLTFNRDFYCGYSPERINPGDQQHRLTTIVKVTSGSTPEAAQKVDDLYATVITAGTHRAGSIKVAEAAKVIENTQRDLNIALVNELALIFNRLDIDTTEVLDAAATKWNFLPFRPGMVGGHCISVDPYYLTYKAQEVDYIPDVILAGRRINDGMGGYIAGRVLALMMQKGVNPVSAKVLILGFTFKEDCPDLRNTGVITVARRLQTYGMSVDVHDPWADPEEVAKEFNFELTPAPDKGAYDAVVVAVAHRQYRDQNPGDIRAYCKPEGIIYDVKSILPKEAVDGRL